MKKLILLSVLGMFSFSSCKKKEPESIANTLQCSKTVFNPPIVVGANSTLPFDTTTTIDECFDLNCDDVKDFRIIIVEGSGAPGKFQDITLSYCNVNFGYSNRSFAQGDTINLNAFSPNVYLWYDFVRNTDLTGQTTVPPANPYIAFVIYLRGKQHFGWIKYQVTGVEQPFFTSRAQFIIEEFYVHPYAEEAVIIE